ncbi:MAG: hypothetical protein ACRC2T_05770 [Thermoguttaceae bacterium]
MKKNKNIYVIFAIVIALFLLSVGLLFLYYENFQNNHTLEITNNTGKNISSLVVLWPDGTCSIKKVKNGNSVVLVHHPKSEGSAELFILFEQERGWHHVPVGGYICPNVRDSCAFTIEASDCKP